MEASVTLLEATTSQSKLPTAKCPRTRKLDFQTAKGPDFKDGSTKAGAPASKASGLSYTSDDSRSMLSRSKGSQGLFVQSRVKTASSPILQFH